VREGRLSVDDLLQTVPQPKEAPVVRKAALRTGSSTGFFDMLCTQDHTTIFSYVDLKTRLAALLTTCIGWKDLAQEPACWDNLIVGSFSYGSPVWINGVGLRRLMHTLPTERTRMLEMGGDNVVANDLTFVLKNVNLPSLRSLRMFGKRVGPSTLAALVKTSFIQNLTHLDLSETKCKGEVLCSVARAAPSLTHFGLPIRIDGQLIERLSDIHRKARGGGTSLIQSLTEGSGIYEAGMGSAALWTMAAHFPELAELKTGGMRIARLPWQPGAQFTRLSTLHINKLMDQGQYGSFFYGERVRERVSE
jgi:hypothetical protein